MNITPEHREDFEAAPAALRQLLEAELAAGNSIMEVGHSHPAPPAGAYFKLANKVSTRPRGPGEGLTFYERNGFNHSGEFTDGKRFYWVLEPPNPPPPDPDMDAIRESLEPKPDSLVQLAYRRAGSIVEHFAGCHDVDASLAITRTETPTGRTHILHFRDKRTPHEIQCALEGELMTLFTAALENEALRLRARADVNGADYVFDLRFVAALAADNCYSLRFEVSWADAQATHHDYFRKTSDSWIRMWTRDLMPANPPAAHEGAPELYRELAEAALKAEAHLDSVAALQQAIIAGLKRGGRFSTSHKEGGTNIFWRIDRFVRSDYGDDPDHKEFKNEAEFLQTLWQFCHWDVSRHAGKEPLSDLEVWKLILRLLRAP